MTAPPPCHVCGQPLEEANTAVCNHCERPFHLTTRQDAAGEDCGEVWIDEQYLALQFACNVCLGKGAAGGEPAVGRGH